ncbi:MAG: hypothetical protein VKJ04_11700 [Vampirovibrionales bacterium]|nr:hypothetical protein [Vampirovibrionales bacterium]
MDIHGLSDENFSEHAYELLSSIFEIDDLKLRLAYIHQKRIDILDLLSQRDIPYSDEQIQMLQADEIALGMLERAYLDSLANEDLSCFIEIIEDLEDQKGGQDEKKTPTNPNASPALNSNVQHIIDPQPINPSRTPSSGKAIS